MNDMNAFERQLSAEVAALMGPVRPVDDAAIFAATITATQSPKWKFQSMLSATKFVVAGAIVALFGGFLLSGVLTQPSDEQLPAVGASASATAQAEGTEAATPEPEPTAEVEPDSTNTTLELLPGVDLVTEEVEPGVYRVLSDGAGRDLVAEPPRALIFTRDGDLLLFSESQEYDTLLGGFYALGVEGEQALDGPGGDPNWFDAAIDGDGNLNARLVAAGWQTGRLARFDGTSWTEPTWPNGSDKVSAIEAAPDGAVWVTRSSTGPGPRVARIEGGVWTVLPVPDDGSKGRYLGAPENFAVAPDGTIWFASNDGSGKPLPKDTKRLLHFDGERWLEPNLPIDPRVKYLGPLAIGPDGALWVYAEDRTNLAAVLPYLLRLSDGEWTVFTEADGVPHLIGNQTFGARLAVDAEGTLWIAFDGDPIGPRTLPPPLGPSDTPHGVLSFDGSTWRQYLKGHHVNRVEVADDGSLWATSLRDCTDTPKQECYEAGDGGLYVITPEAVAAADAVEVEPAERAEPADTAAPELLPGVDLITEEVEPGVFRVVSDGTENDMAFGESDPEPTQVVAGQDGSVWVFDQERLVRLGRPGSVNTSDLDEYWHDISVAPDGTVWALGRRGAFGSRSLFSLNDGEWQSHPLPDRTWASGIATPPDGSVWASLAVGSGDCRVARLVDGAWQQEAIEPASTNAGGESLAVGPDGTMLLGSACGGGGRLLERGEDGWAPPAVFDDSRAADFEFIGPIAIGLDGTAWVNMLGRGGTRLARRADGDWEIIGDDGSVPTLHGPQVWELSMTVSDDGRLWAAFDDPAVALADNRDYFNDSGNNYLAALGSGCPGAISFDGTTWSQHLAGACVTHVSAAPNGNVWATVVESPAFEEHSLDPARAPTGLYVITPEAVAATE